MANLGSLLSSRQFWVLTPWLLMAAVGATLAGSAQAGFLALYNGESRYLNGFWGWPQRLTLNVWRRSGRPGSPERLVSADSYWRLVAVMSGVLEGLSAIGVVLMLPSGDAMPAQDGLPSALASLAFLGSTSLIMGVGAWFRGNQILSAVRQLAKNGSELGVRHNTKTVTSVTNAFFGCGLMSGVGIMKLGELVVRYLGGVLRQ